jgi:hypothetical protein
VSRYLLLAFPYVLQLFCIIHVMKTGRDSYWIWIIILLPYIGGLAYLIVEILPELRLRRNMTAIKANVAQALAPGKKIEALKNKAAYSPTVENKLEYADALSAQGDHESALSVYKSCLEGLPGNNPAILYKTALTLFKLGDYRGAFEHIERLGKNVKGIYEQKAWNALYLQVLENLEPESTVAAEYVKISTLLNDRDIDCQYLEYLERVQDFGKLRSMIEKIHVEEASLREMNVRYDKTFYKKAYTIGKRIGR